MINAQPEIRLTRKLIDALYIEAMVLADEARAYFDRVANEERDQLTPVLRVTFSCESLKVTTRLMHVIAWLLTRRAVETGDIDPVQGLEPNYRLGEAIGTNAATIARLPGEAQQLIVSSCDLYARVRRFDNKLDRSALSFASPARALFRQLEQAF